MAEPSEGADVPKPRPARKSRPARWQQHRDRLDQSAHLSADLDGPAAPPPEHPLIPRGHSALLNRPDQLHDLIDHLRAAGSFAYDSEFIGELTYIPKLCLIQVASTQRVALIDPLADLDLTPFWELIADASVEKIVHAGQQDLEPVVRHINRSPANIFDTQIAAGFAALAYPTALVKLVRELTGARIGKGMTVSHWDRRPLSSMQLRYAADDVRYLPAIRAELQKRLAKYGHADWVRAECQSLCDATLYQFDAEVQINRVRGSGLVSAAARPLLRELVIWRNAAAELHDVPPRSFLRDEILVDLARHPVHDVADLSRVRGLPRPVQQAHGPDIIAAIARGVGAPAAAIAPANEQNPGHFAEESPTDKFRTDSLWALFQCLCLGRGIDPNLVASRQDIVYLYRCRNDENEPDDLRLLYGWRRDAVGQLLLQILRSEKSAQVAWTDSGLGLRPES